MEYPDAREVIESLVDGQTFAGVTVEVCYKLGADFVEQARASDTSGQAPVLLFVAGGTEGVVDRVDRIGVQVYGVGTATLKVAEAIRARLSPDPLSLNAHDTPAGYVDDIRPETLPVDVPFSDPVVTEAQFVALVTSRPI